MKSLYLNNVGVINAIGHDRESVLASALACDTSGMLVESGWLVQGDVTVAPVKHRLPDMPDIPIHFQSRNNQLLYAAYQQIEPEIAELIKCFGADRVAVVLGSSTSGISETENALQVRRESSCFPKAYRYEQQEMGSPALFLAEVLGLKNVALTISTACSSSAKAFSTARNLIDTGFCDAALVGGVDTLCRLTINGFNALESVSSSICKPFSKDRDGISIGEGAGLFILSPQKSDIELAGVGESSDAYHMSAPDPEGLGAEVAMRQALEQADIGPEHVAYINLHGTGTVKNDAMESVAVNRIFGSSTPCSSTKSLTGHTLGAAGATEVALCWLLLSEHNAQNQLPPQYWGGETDEALATLNFVKPHDDYRSAQQPYMLSNSFAFGGNNVSVILKKG